MTGSTEIGAQTSEIACYSTAMKFSIAPANPVDAAEIIALWEACGLTRPWNDPVQDVALALNGLNSTILFTRYQGSVIGSVMVGFDGHRGWIYYLAVAPERRRTGLGRALVAEAENWLRRHGAPKLQLMVRDGNDAALAFYRSLGFEASAVTTLGRIID